MCASNAPAESRRRSGYVICAGPVPGRRLVTATGVANSFEWKAA
jgi:hypothetical protein